nr:MAG TPA: hypothetical protein [Caudoviricetes sp.]
MTKWNVCGLTVETKDGKNAIEIFNNSTNQTPTYTYSFDNLEDAKKCYEDLSTRVYYNPYHKIYVHSCKYIEEIEIDEDGDFVDGDWVIDNFPDYISPNEDEKDED